MTQTARERLAFLLFCLFDYVCKEYKTKDTWETWKKIKHGGDCTQEAHTCFRCIQDEIYEKADAILKAGFIHKDSVRLDEEKIYQIIKPEDETDEVWVRYWKEKAHAIATASGIVKEGK